MKLGFRTLLSALVLSSALLAGCASPANPDAMRAHPTPLQIAAIQASAVKGEIGINRVSGGGETNPMWTSKVADNDFRKALESSLSDVGALANPQATSKYELNVSLRKLDQPMMGIDMTVTAGTDYELVDRKTRETVRKVSVDTPYTAKFSDAFSGVERLKLANEGSIRENITKFIDELVLFFKK